MTREEAIKILDPETTAAALAEIEYYAGFSGPTAKVQAVSEACEIAVATLREREEHTCDTCYGNDMAPDEADNPCWNCKGGHSEWAPKEEV